jgi:hypothetical protein
MNFFRQPRWSPYVAGALIGVLSWVTFLWMGKALGTSTTAVRLVGMAEAAVAPGRVAENAYLNKYIFEKAPIEWQLFLVMGLPLGALAAAWLGRSYQSETVPELWKWRFGPSKWLRYGAAFLGGVLVLFGARMAGGCTSGHGISGGLQLSVSSWIFFAAFFITGIVTAFALFGKEGRNHV